MISCKNASNRQVILDPHTKLFNVSTQDHAATIFFIGYINAVVLLAANLQVAVLAG